MSDPRLEALAELVLELAGGDYSARGTPSEERDEVDALVVGFNLLAETLEIERHGRDAAEALLRDEQHAYDHAPGMFVSVDAQRLDVVKCNATFSGRLVLAKENVVGRPLTDFFVAADRDALTAELREVARGRDIGRSDYQLVAATGQVVPVLLSASYVVAPRGRIRLIARDMTRERSLEAQLRQAQKMEAVGRLASGVAHDFNNLLTVVMAASSRLSTRLKAAGERTAEIDMIMSAAERAGDLTKQLLAMARADVAQPAVHDLNQLVVDARPLLASALRDGVELRYELASGELPVHIDATQLTQVVLNLTLNASDAMPRGGQVTLRTSVHDGGVTMEVADEGTGMSPQVLERALEPFFTTKTAAKGSGLGLAICYGLVKAAHGVMHLESTPGQGTTVRIELPLAEEAPTSVTRPAPSSRSEGLRLLVVDDTAAVRSVLAMGLRANGFEVREAEGAEAAIAIAVEHSIDLVVTDVVMPERDGSELARALWQEQPSLPVIFISGYTGDRLDPETLAAPNVHFLQKPFSMEKLVDAIHELAGAARPTPQP